jgi:choline dehydrogenase-like flavoprotein
MSCIEIMFHGGFHGGNRGIFRDKGSQKEANWNSLGGLRMEKRLFDAIVVGTGPGGATVARELTNRGKRVLMLEWGPYKPVTGSTFNAVPQFATPGRSLLFTPRLHGIARGITTGGSTIYYYGTAFDPPLEMFKSYGVDIGKEVEETRHDLPVGPLPDEWIGPMSRRIMESAQDLGFEWKKLNKFFYKERLENAGKAGWGWMAAPNYESKWNARMYVDEAVRKGAKIINRAKVKRVIIEGRKAAGVEFSMWGIKKRAYANTIVISAGGIGSPLILRATGIKDAGYDYFFDPLILVMGAVKDLKASPEIPMGTGIHFEEEGYVMTDLYAPPLLYSLNQVEGLRLQRLFSQSRALQIMVKTKDNLGGRLTDWGGVRKILSKEDKDKLRHGYERAKKILRNAGATGIFKGWVVASHPGGTVKINDVLDSNLKTEYDNLYVCDCSVIPEAWGLPPVFTLVSLARRLAKHIAKG